MSQSVFTCLVRFRLATVSTWFCIHDVLRSCRRVLALPRRFERTGGARRGGELQLPQARDGTQTFDMTFPFTPFAGEQRQTEVADGATRQHCSRLYSQEFYPVI